MNKLTDIEFNNKVGETLRAVRKQKGLTLKQVGLDLYIDYSYIASIERGANAPLSLLFALAKYYNISMATLFQENQHLTLSNEWTEFIADMKASGITVDDLRKYI